MTSGNYAGLRPLCAPDQNQEQIHLAVTCAYLWLVVGLLFFHHYFSHPPYWLIQTMHRAVGTLVCVI